MDKTFLQATEDMKDSSQGEGQVVSVSEEGEKEDFESYHNYDERTQKNATTTGETAANEAGLKTDGMQQQQQQQQQQQHVQYLPQAYNTTQPQMAYGAHAGTSPAPMVREF